MDNETVQAVPSSGNRIWMILSGVLFITFVIYIIINPPGSGSSETVAKVNGESISKEQFYEALVAMQGRQVLSNLIDTAIVNQAAEKANITASEHEVEEELAYIKSGYHSDEEFNQELSMYGMTLDSLKADMYVQVKMRKILEPLVTVTDEEVRAFYDENLELLTTPAQVNPSHIVVKTKDEAEAILRDLQAGADFATVAKEKSLDANTKDNGGNMGFISYGHHEEAFVEAAFAIEIGQLSNVIETDDGFHIIKVSERTAASTPTFEEKQEEIKEQLLAEKVSELSITWMEEQREEAEIETSLAS